MARSLLETGVDEPIEGSPEENLSMTTRTGWLKTAVLAGGMLLLGVSSASAFALNDLILNGGFGTDATPSLTSWTGTATNVNARASTDAINTTGGNSGFNSFFTTAFAVLGDATGAITAADTPNSGLSTLTQTFSLPTHFGGDLVQSYDLTISFRSVFDGDDSNTPSKDIFSVTLTPPSGPAILLYSVDSTALPDCGPNASPCANSQIVQNPFTASGGSLAGLLAGTYTLTFQIDEKGLTGANTTNTAVGVDDVDIDAIGLLAAPNPGALLLLTAGLGTAGFLARRRRRA